jgi:hypothetical protein
VIEMTPPAKRGVILQRQNDTTLGAVEASIAPMIQENLDALVLGFEG